MKPEGGSKGLKCKVDDWVWAPRPLNRGHSDASAPKSLGQIISLTEDGKFARVRFGAGKKARVYPFSIKDLAPYSQPEPGAGGSGENDHKI